MQTIEEQICEIITEPLEAKNIEVVQVRLIDGDRRKTLQILAENMQTGRITLDECADASRTISALLDVEDTIKHAFNLEVSSPGVDRPLVKAADFEKYLGFEAKVETKLPINNRRRFKGLMKTLADEAIEVVVDGESHMIALKNIQAAKLILTDALLKAHQDGKFNKQTEVVV